jgi:hypothetical protein
VAVSLPVADGPMTKPHVFKLGGKWWLATAGRYESGCVYELRHEWWEFRREFRRVYRGW